MKKEIIRTVIISSVVVVLWSIIKEVVGFENTTIIALATIYARIK